MKIDAGGDFPGPFKSPNEDAAMMHEKCMYTKYRIALEDFFGPGVMHDDGDEQGLRWLEFRPNINLYYLVSNSSINF